MEWQSRLTAGITRAAKPEASEQHNCVDCGKPLDHANYYTGRSGGTHGPMCDGCDEEFMTPIRAAIAAAY